MVVYWMTIYGMCVSVVVVMMAVAVWQRVNQTRLFFLFVARKFPDQNIQGLA